MVGRARPLLCCPFGTGSRWRGTRGDGLTFRSLFKAIFAAGVILDPVIDECMDREESERGEELCDVC